ncbi:MAG: winged helix-turn-helix domain-containing protein [Pseudomonadales bacterium]|nr:winged helix-turn-helix domain-containing protein [Pseudomonadales bacterium]MCP5190745.1 winged helix-turn-helix domain-containing protein [Pseudomonadales bacterium]MCP5203753.1 winged helix-turn-helix domain-containing protein [Pseudomonadales bacterium]
MMTCYHIGAVEFFPDACEIRVAGRMEHLQPRLRDVLVCLVRHRGEVVSRETLLREAWHGRAASDECLTRCIYLLRKQLRARNLVETVACSGYRLHHCGHEVGIAGSPLPGALRATGLLPSPPPPMPPWFC